MFFIIYDLKGVGFNENFSSALLFLRIKYHPRYDLNGSPFSYRAPLGAKSVNIPT